MAIARIQEQLGVLDFLHESARGVDVALLGKELVGVHAVDLDGHTLGPLPELRDGCARLKESGPAGAGPGLGKLLRGHDPQRDADVDDIAGQLLGSFDGALEAAAAESAPAHDADRLRFINRHARISREHATAFWDRVFELTREFSGLPRTGDEVYAFVAGLFPTQYPSLQPGQDEDAEA